MPYNGKDFLVAAAVYKRLFNNICEFTGQKVRDGFISELKEHSGGYVTETKR